MVSVTWARMMRSMLADQPYLEVTTTQGVLLRRVLIFTFSTSGSARAPFHQLTTPLELLLRRARNNFGGQLAYSQGRVPVLFKARLLTAAGHQLQADCWQMQMQTLQATEVIHGC